MCIRDRAYEVFYKNAGADAYSYTSFGTVEALKQNFMRVTGLTPGATYDFAFKPLLPGGKDGGLSRPLTATTAKAVSYTHLDVYKRQSQSSVVTVLPLPPCADTNTKPSCAALFTSYEALFAPGMSCHEPR